MQSGRVGQIKKKKKKKKEKKKKKKTQYVPFMKFLMVEESGRGSGLKRRGLLLSASLRKAEADTTHKSVLRKEEGRRL